MAESGLKPDARDNSLSCRNINGIYGIGANDATYTTTLNTGAWYHIALTYNGTTLRLYLNGIERASTTASGSGSIDEHADQFFVGAGGDISGNPTDFFSGYLDDAVIFNRELNSTEVGDIYNGSTVSRNAGQVYRAKATNHIYSDVFVGFAADNISVGNSGNVVVNGLASGFSNLTVGKQHYLSDSLGGISTNAGTVARKVGIAVSSSTLLVTNSW